MDLFPAEPPKFGDSPRGSVSSRDAEVACERLWWSEAMTAMINEKLAEQTKQLQDSFAEEVRRQALQLQSPAADPPADAVRSAVRAELVDDALAEGGYLRHAMRSEMEAALESWDGRLGRSAKSIKTARTATQGTDRERSPPIIATRQMSDPRVSACLVDTLEIDRLGKAKSFLVDDSKHSSGFESFDLLGRGKRLWKWWRKLEEPPRSGCLYRTLQHTAFDCLICLVITLDFAFMIYATDMKILSPSSPTSSIPGLLVGNWVFQVFFTLEMVMKLVIHRQWFFCGARWKTNTFDFLVVVSGFLFMYRTAFSSSSGANTRVLRVLRVAKALRAFEVLNHVKELRALLACLEGSFKSLFWSMFMLLALCSIVSLFLMQIVITHLIQTGDALEDTPFDGSFGTFGEALLTLFKASTGGNDWGDGYDIIKSAGFLGSVVYLFFITFVQFAVMNIITGIFVDSAMSVLSRDSEALAEELNQNEEMNMNKLETLCRDVDEDHSGKLTRDQFEASLSRKHVPLLLTMLGLGPHNVLDLFNHMAYVADDNGQVEISSFVNLCMYLRGSATNYDLHKLHAEFKAMQSQHGEDVRQILEILRGVIQDPVDS